jgi:hypothetical protein
MARFTSLQAAAARLLARQRAVLEAQASLEKTLRGLASECWCRVVGCGHARRVSHTDCLGTAATTDCFPQCPLDMLQVATCNAMICCTRGVTGHDPRLHVTSMLSPG